MAVTVGAARELAHRSTGLGKSVGSQLTVDEGVENELAVLLDEVVDVSENSTARWLQSATVLPWAGGGPHCLVAGPQLESRGSWRGRGRGAVTPGGDEGTYHMLTQLRQKKTKAMGVTEEDTKNDEGEV